MKETELYLPVKKLLEEDGYEIRAEVSGADITAVKGDELLIVEMKISFNLKLLMQAVKRQRMTDNVYIAIPSPTYKKRFSKEMNDREYLMRRLSQGLIYVITETEDTYAVKKFHPKPINMKKILGITSTKTKRLIK